MGIGGKGAAVASAIVSLAFAASAGAAPSAHAARVGPAANAQRLNLVLPLTADYAGLKRRALAVTTPGSSEYGAYESVSALARRYGASTSTRSRVVSYLKRVGATHVRVDVTGLFADATMPVAVAERLFATPLATFRANTGARYIAPDLGSAAAASASVPLPAELKGLVTGVVGLDTRPLSNTGTHPAFAAHSKRIAHAAAQTSSAAPRSGTPGGCAAGIGSGGFTPNQILSAYGYDTLHAQNVNGQGQRVALIEIDGFNDNDINTFASCFGLGVPEIKVFGVGTRLLPPGGESTLDLEVLDAAAPQLDGIDVYETKPSAAETLQALTAPLRTRNKPQIISASLGLCEPIVFAVLKKDGVLAAEGSLEIAAASGTTFLASSGDSGSADCTRRDGSPDSLKSVNYPSSSWWVTGVGGTNFTLDANNHILTQVVWNDTTDQPGSAGGGGESDLFFRPSYQKGSPYPHSRAVPDVSMLSDILPGYAIYCSASPDCVNSHSTNPWVAIGGTSAATPLLAGGFALVNQQLRAAHRDILGFANPLLYNVAQRAGASVFFDVTGIGNDIGPDVFGKPIGCCTAGTGYDDASGLGSVNVTAFAQQALAMQPEAVSVSLRVPGGQHPVHNRHLLATVGCSGPCTMGALAELSVGKIVVFSDIVHLPGAGKRTLKLGFGPGDLRKLRAALAAHKRITATIDGVMFDPAVLATSRDPINSIRASATKKLKITS